MDKDKVWQIVLENLKINISTANFATWFTQTFIITNRKVGEERQIVEIGCPNPFAKDTIENRYYGLIKEALDQTTNLKNELIFLVKQSEKPVARKTAKPQEPLFEKVEEDHQDTEAQQAIECAGLRPDFNFDTFAVSSTNQMAHAAAQAIAQAPGKAYNPFFIYGGVGVGKTHLMQAIANAVLLKNPKIKCVYCTGEEFTNEIVNAIRRRTTDEFKKKYRLVKILMVDDIQFIAGKEKAQEEFFHTFNAVWRVGGQVVMTSDRKPDEIQMLEDRLRSRFEGGLIIDIQPPDFELRAAILLIKAQQKEIKLPMDVAQLIAGNITSTRRLEGFLVRLATEAKAKNIAITPELATALLGTNNENLSPQKLVKPKEVVNAVANHFDIKLAELTGPRRVRQLVVPRQILMYLLRNELKLPLMEIGRMLGGRDHTTVIHGVEKVTHLLPESEDIRVDIAGIRKRLYG